MDKKQIAKIALVALPLMALLIIASSSPSLAAPSKVRIMEFSYSQESPGLALVKSATKIGFSPDYRFYGSQSYSLRVLGSDGTNLYSFKFMSPVFAYSHEYDGENISGGLMLLTENTFALSLPVVEGEARIMILDEKNNVVFSQAIEDIMALEPAVPQNQGKYASLALLSAIAIVFAAFIAGHFIGRKKN